MSFSRDKHDCHYTSVDLERRKISIRIEKRITVIKITCLWTRDCWRSNINSLLLAFDFCRQIHYSFPASDHFKRLSFGRFPSLDSTLKVAIWKEQVGIRCNTWAGLCLKKEDRTSWKTSKFPVFGFSYVYIQWRGGNIRPKGSSGDRGPVFKGATCLDWLDWVERSGCCW
jgi:hypothetical protein